MPPTYPYSQIINVSVSPRSTTNLIDTFSYWAIISYLTSQMWGIPVLVISELNWALWPLLSDFVWFTMLPLAVISLLRGIPYATKSRPTILSMGVFVFYALLTFFLAWLRFNLPTSQIAYFGYSLFRLFQFFTVWIVSLNVRLTPERQQRILWVIVCTGIVVGVAALIQQFGLLDYRLLVSHLPSDATAGPWAIRTLLLPDAALGTLNYNRIYTGHFLASIMLITMVVWQFSLRSVPLLLCLGAALLATQSRTAFIPLVVGIGYVFLLKPRLRHKVVIVFFVLVLGGLAYFGVDTLRSVAAIQTREETIEESFSGRFERQLVAIDKTYEDELSLFVGIGLGNLGYFWLGGGFAPSHGQFATTLAEMGIIGVILLLYLVSRLVLNISAINSFTLAIIAVLIGNIASALFNDLLMPSPAFGHYLGFLYCLAGLGVVASIHSL